MRLLRFKHVFAALMALAALSAFGIPAKYSDRATPQVQTLFAPVSRPVRAVTLAIVDRVAPREAGEPIPPRELQEELAALRQDNIKLRYDFDELARRNGEREKLGSIGDLCTPVAVLGGDGGTHESLAVQGSSLQGLRDGMFVLYSGGIVGTLQRSGVAGGQVQLVTDPNSTIEGYFEKFRRASRKTEADKTTRPKQERRYPIRGAGLGKMVCRLVQLEEKNRLGLEVGDIVVADDIRLPTALRGRPIGRISEIRPDTVRPLQFVEIDITPNADLLKLREVMVLSKEK